VIGEVAELVEFSVDAITEGINAVGGVTVRLRLITDADTRDNEDVRAPLSTGFAVHTDILVATAEAYVSALNALLRAQARRAGVVTPSEAIAAVPAGSSA
jgi:2-isopropylmalate synthase